MKNILINNHINGIMQLRHFTNTAVSHARSHYDSLGLTPKATQGEVKTAYYNLSMQYHPDKNTDSEDAAMKFREVTEAYEVLGNVKMRRLYDRGMTHGLNPAPAPVYKREVKSRPPPPSGRTPIFNFDEWSRAHYGNTFAKDMAIKHNIHLRSMKQKRDRFDIQTEKVVLMMFVMLGLGLYFTIEDNDINRLNGNGSNAIPSELPSKEKADYNDVG